MEEEEKKEDLMKAQKIIVVLGVIGLGFAFGSFAVLTVAFITGSAQLFLVMVALLVCAGVSLAGMRRTRRLRERIDDYDSDKISRSEGARSDYKNRG